MTAPAPKEGDLMVWWMPQLPMPSFNVPVPSVEEAVRLLEVLAQYDLYQLERRVKPDYSNAGGLLIFEDGEWVDWCDEENEDVDGWLARDAPQSLRDQAADIGRWRERMSDG